jgi:glyoxylate/hydroxypyruvate reductase A
VSGPGHDGVVRVLAMAPQFGRDLSYLAVDPRVEVLDGLDAYAAELHAEDPSRRPPAVDVAVADREGLLAQADVLLIGAPVLRDLASRMPRLAWAHSTGAGASNYHRSDLWTADRVVLTSGRGTSSPRGIAEWAIAASMFGLRGLDEATRQKHDGRFSKRGYLPAMRTALGSTMGIVGLGGIGRELGRLAQGLGMRVVATRWSIDTPEHDVDGADLVLPADRLLEVAAQSDVLVVCSQLTDETRGLIGRDVLAAMPSHGVLVNVARGEEVDEAALVEAVEGEQIALAVLDVYDGEMDGRPAPAALLSHPRILLVPHMSWAGDAAAADLGRELVADNLRRFLAGEPLRNVIDRARGY